MTDEQRIRTYDRTGEPHDEVLRTRTGRVLTEEDLDRLAEEAQHEVADPDSLTDRSR